MPPRDFLTLPYELRHHIYKDYFTLNDGYAFQPGPGKLAAADGQPLNLSLMYTCRFIASETKDLPLMLNDISFSTVYHSEWRAWAGRFDYLLRAQTEQREALILYLGHFVTPEIMSQIAARYPWFVPQLDDAIRSFGGDPLRQVFISDRLWPLSRTLSGCLSAPFHPNHPSESALCRAVDFTLRLLAQNSGDELARAIGETVGHWQGCRGLDDFFDQCYEPWDIPSWDSLAATGRRFKDDELWSYMGRWYPNDENENEYRSKYRFSATAVAIRFLKHLSVDKRLCIRKLIIREDRVAVGGQECHSLGLIPFCKENSQLRINLRVNMITNICQRSVISRFGSFEVLEDFATHTSGDRAFDQATRFIFHPLAHWLTEALALTDAGMPAGSYTLTLDGESAIDLCSDIFQREVLQRVAMRKAIVRCFPCQPGKLRRDMLYDFSNNYVEAFEHLVNQTSFLRSNFHPGHMWDVDQLIAARSGYDMQKWFNEYCLPTRFDFSTSIYIPLLGPLLMENYERRPCSGHRDPHIRDPYDWMDAA